MTKTEQAALAKVYCDTSRKLSANIKQTAEYRRTLNTIAEDLIFTAEEGTHLIPDGAGHYLLLVWNSDRCCHYIEIVNSQEDSNENS